MRAPILALVVCAHSAQAWRGGVAPGLSKLAAARHTGTYERAPRAAISLSTSAPAPRTLSDCERAFERLYPKPVYPPYSGVVEEVFSSLVITLADSRYEYSRLFAIGLYTILSRLLVVPPSVERGVENRPADREMAAAVCAALDLDWETIERDACGVIEWAKGYSEPEMYAYVFGADAPPDAIAAEAVVSTAVDGPDRPAVEDGSSEPADAEQRAAGPFSAMRLILSQRMRAVQLGGGKPGGDASEAAAAAPEPAAVDAGKALVLELGALRGNSYGLYHRALGVGLAELLRLGGATPTLGSVSKWATALGLKDAKVVRDVEWFLATADKVYDVEERKLDDQVRKMRAHAQKLTADALAAKRLADEADGIVVDAPASKTDAADQVVAAAAQAE